MSVDLSRRVGKIANKPVFVELRSKDMKAYMDFADAVNTRTFEELSQEHKKLIETAEKQ